MRVYDKQLIYAANDCYIAYRAGRFYRVSLNFAESVFLCSVVTRKIEKVLHSCPLAVRLFRLTPRAIIGIDNDNILFAYKGYIYRLNFRNGDLVIEHDFQSPMRAPLSFYRITGLKGFKDTIVYGEYHGNIDGGPMSIYARTISATWKKVYTFHSSTILHIHGFCADYVNDRLLIMTGDNDSESGFWEAYNNFEIVRPILLGSQKYRACVAYSTNSSSIIYPTDTPLESNMLFELDQTNVITSLYEMPGPCIFAREHNGKYLFATSVEGDSRMNKMRYLFTRKIGPGVKDKFVHIIYGSKEDGFKEIMRLKKDNLPYLLFEFGNASFCEGFNKNVIINPQSIKGFYQKSIILD